MTDAARALRFRRGAAMREGDRGRTYIWAGKEYWSVTSIISSGIPKPQLIRWAAKMTATWAIENRDVWIPVARRDPEAAIELLKGSPWRDRAAKMRLGSAVHDVAEAYVLGRPMPEPSEAVAPYLTAFQSFLSDFRPTFVAVEAPVFNPEDEYAGTLDAIIDVDHAGLARRCGVEGRPVRLLIDYKTGSGIYDDVALQLAAYRYGKTFLGLPSTDEEPVPDVDGAAAVWLRPDGYDLIWVQADEAAFRSFLYAREVFRWVEVLAPAAVGRVIQPEPQPAELAAVE